MIYDFVGRLKVFQHYTESWKEIEILLTNCCLKKKLQKREDFYAHEVYELSMLIQKDPQRVWSSTARRINACCMLSIPKVDETASYFSERSSLSVRVIRYFHRKFQVCVHAKCFLSKIFTLPWTIKIRSKVRKILDFVESTSWAFSFYLLAKYASVEDFVLSMNGWKSKFRKTLVFVKVFSWACSSSLVPKYTSFDDFFLSMVVWKSKIWKIVDFVQLNFLSSCSHSLYDGDVHDLVKQHFWLQRCFPQHYDSSKGIRESIFFFFFFW